MSEQKTIFKKWDEGEITILPSEPSLTKQEILVRLRDPNLPSEEKARLTELLYNGIDIK